MNEGYLDWLALAPEGKVPGPTGTPDQPNKSTDAWTHLETGVENRKPLSEVYPAEVLNELATSTETMNLAGFQCWWAGWSAPSLPPLPIPKALAATLNGTLDPGAATKQAQADLEQIAQSIT